MSVNLSLNLYYTQVDHCFNQAYCCLMYLKAIKLLLINKKCFSSKIVEMVGQVVYCFNQVYCVFILFKGY